MNDTFKGAYKLMLSWMQQDLCKEHHERTGSCNECPAYYLADFYDDDSGACHLIQVIEEI